MKYAIITGNRYRIVELRETAKYFIDDNLGDRYKKHDGEKYLAMQKNNIDNWRTTYSYVFNVDSDEVKKIIEEDKKRQMVNEVKTRLHKMIPSLTYERAVDIANKLNFQDLQN